MVRRIVPSETFQDEPYWLLQMALSGLLDQLRERTGPNRYRDLNRGQVATMLGWGDAKLSRIFDPVEDGTPPQGLEPDRGMRDTLVDIKTHLHVFGARNYPDAAPGDPRRVMLTELWARLFEEPQRAQLSVPPGWFKDLALMLSPDVERPVSPQMVVAAGQALLHNIELQDTDATALKRGSAAPIAVMASLSEREALAENLSEGQGLVENTVEALVSVGQLPPALHGVEAMLILARLRLPSVLTTIESHIRHDGLGFRLWRALSMYLKAERFVLRRLPVDRRDAYLFDGSALHVFDRILLRLLREPPQVDPYPARSLSIETIEQRLKLFDAQVELTSQLTREDLYGDGDDVGIDVDEEAVDTFRPEPALVRRRCVAELVQRIDDPSRTERERAYAALILSRRDYERIPRLAVVGRAGTDLYKKDGLLHHALSEIASAEDMRPYDRAPLGDDERIRRAERDLAEWVRGTLDDHARRQPVPEALLRDPTQPVPQGGSAQSLVAGSALETAIFTLIRDYDGVWRRRVADALRTGMLSGVVAPILSRFLAPGGPSIHGAQVRVLPWMRELAVLGISFQSAFNDDEVLDALIRTAYPAAEPVLDDDDERAAEAHAALWALADLTLYVAATTAKLTDEVTARLRKVRRAFVELAEQQPRGSIQRALAYGLVCVEQLDLDVDVDDDGKPIGRDNVRALVVGLRKTATDETVQAILGTDDADPRRPPVERALGGLGPVRRAPVTDRTTAPVG